jgi:hypothetical protein
VPLSKRTWCGVIVRARLSMAPRTQFFRSTSKTGHDSCCLREMTHPTEIGTTTFRFETSPHGRLRLHEWSAPAHGLGSLLCGNAKDRDLRRVQYAGRVRRSRQGTTVRSIWSVWVSDLHGPGAIATAAKSKSLLSRHLNLLAHLPVGKPLLPCRRLVRPFLHLDAPSWRFGIEEECCPLRDA